MLSANLFNTNGSKELNGYILSELRGIGVKRVYYSVKNKERDEFLKRINYEGLGMVALNEVFKPEELAFRLPGWVLSNNNGGVLLLQEPDEMVRNVLKTFGIPLVDIHGLEAKRYKDVFTSKGIDINTLRFGTTKLSVMGDELRKSILGYVRKKGGRYFGLGDEFESSSLNINSDVSLSSLKFDKPFGTLNQVEEKGRPIENYVGVGQKKLETIVFPLICESVNLLYIGGSPGNNLGNLITPEHNIINIDPREYSGPGVHMKKFFTDDDVKDYFSGKDFTVMMDIRRDREDFSNREDWLNAVDNDTEMMLRWSEGFKLVKNCLATCIKFRVVKKIIRIEGYEMLFQPYIWTKSFETRLYWFRKRWFENVYVFSPSQYKRMVNAWNYMREKDSGLDLEQDIRIRKMRYFHGDSLSMKKDVSDYSIGLFNISNVVNDRQKSMQYMVKNKGVYFVPSPWFYKWCPETKSVSNLENSKLEGITKVFDPTNSFSPRVGITVVDNEEESDYVYLPRYRDIQRFLGEQDDVKLVDDFYKIMSSDKVISGVGDLNYGFTCDMVNGHKVVTTSIGSQVFQDHVFSVAELLGMSCRIVTPQWLLGHFGGSWDSRSHFLNRWVVLINDEDDFRESKWQDSIWSQTPLSKNVSLVLRRLFSLKDSSLHSIRSKVLGDDGFEVIQSARVNGRKKINGRWFYVAVAGHMINMMLSMSYYPVDFVRYFDQIEINLITVSGKNTEWTKRRKELFEEDRRPRLWHSYLDYRYAIEVVRSMNANLSLNIAESVFNYASSRLNSLRKVYKVLNKMGFQSLSYSRNPSSY